MSRLNLPLLVILAIVILLALSSTASSASPPLTDQDIGRLYCQGPRDVSCCPVVAHHVAVARSAKYASIVLINHSGHNITLYSVSLEDGRWITPSLDFFDETVSCEPKEDLSNGDSQAFASIDNSRYRYDAKVKGHATFMIEDGTLSTFTINWRVPTSARSAVSVVELSENYNATVFLGVESVYKVTIIGNQPTIESQSSFGWGPFTAFLFILLLLGCCYMCAVRMINGRLRVGPLSRLLSDHEDETNSLRDGPSDGPADGLRSGSRDSSTSNHPEASQFGTYGTIPVQTVTAGKPDVD